MRPGTPGFSRGFTLLELTVSSAVALVVVVGIAATFGALQSAVNAEAASRSAMAGGRNGIEYLERLVRLAGYGVDPIAAFDFSPAVPDATGCSPGLPNSKNNCAGTGFVTDDLAFRFRDPSFLRRGSFGPTGLTLSLQGGTTFGVDLPAGKGFVVACPGGQAYGVLRAGAAVSAAATSAALVADPAVPTPGQPALGANAPGCMQGTGADAPYVMLLQEVRVRVMPTGAETPPVLVAFYDLTSSDLGAGSRFAPLAQGVEDFQVAYVMNRPDSGGVAPDAAGNADWIFADAADDGLPDPAALPPTYEVPYAGAARFSANPGNIRAVRLSVVLSAPMANGVATLPPQAVEDHVPAATPDGRFRIRLQSTISLPNMVSRTFFVPPVGGDSRLVWGG